MKLIIALGNFEDKYRFTRHNAGFMFADYLAYNLNFSFKRENKFFADIAKFDFENEHVLIIKPITYMNLSGKALRAVIDFYKVNVTDILVIYDDISLNIGTLRFRPSGSSGGHNGIKSIIEVLGGNSKFDRLKIGIGPQPDKMPAEAFVLGNFTNEQLDDMKNTLKKAEEALRCYYKEGLSIAQNKFN